MAIINRVANGLLGLLDTKSQGRTPGEIEDIVRPTLDLEKYYAAAKGLEQATVIAGTGAPGPIQGPQIPDGERWLVYGVTALGIQSVAVGDVQIGLSLDNVIGSGIARMGIADGEYVFNVALGASVQVSIVFPVPLILQPPVRFNCEVNTITAGTTTLFISAMFVRL